MTNLSQQRTSFSLNELALGSLELSKILTYPHGNEKEYSERLSELEDLGVSSIFTGGRTVIGGISIAGKGCVGLVVRAETRKKIMCALKIRRTDANRPNMNDEVRYHNIANDAGVGPRIIRYSKNFLLMKFVEGVTILEWARRSEVEDKQDSSAIATSVLEQCFALDRAGLDHGELSHVDRHVIVDGGQATIIDFESASVQRRPSNVSSAGQSLLVSGAVASALSKVLQVDREQAIRALKKYKNDQTRNNLEAILALVDIT